MRVINENGMNNTHCNPFKSASRILKRLTRPCLPFKSSKKYSTRQKCAENHQIPFFSQLSTKLSIQVRIFMLSKVLRCPVTFLDTPPIPISLKWTTTYFSWWTIVVQPPKVRTQPFYRVAKKAGTHVQPASRTNHH